MILVKNRCLINIYYPSGGAKKSKTSKDCIKVDSANPIGLNLQIKLTDFYVGENKVQTAFVMDQEFFLDFKVSFKLTFLKHNEYIDNFLGYTAIKVLETKLFDVDMK